MFTKITKLISGTVSHRYRPTKSYYVHGSLGTSLGCLIITTWTSKPSRLRKFIDPKSNPNNSDPQIYKGDSRTCTNFIPAWGSNWGSSGFSRNQKIYCSPGMKIIGAFALRLFLRVWSAKTWIPPIWGPWMTRQLTGGYTRSGISLVYLCSDQRFQINSRHCVKDLTSYK